MTRHLNNKESNGGQPYCVFTLGEKDFAFRSEKVWQVLDYAIIIKLPRTATLLRGLIMLHGQLVPVMDLRFKLGMGVTQQTKKTCIVILEIMIGDEAKPIAVLADSVKGIIHLKPDQVSLSFNQTVEKKGKSDRGAAAQHSDALSVLDINELFSRGDLETIQRILAVKQINAAGLEVEHMIPSVWPGLHAFEMGRLAGNLLDVGQ